MRPASAFARGASALVCIAFGASALMSACARDQAAAPLAKPTNLLVVTIDTLRADRLGVYGAARLDTEHRSPGSRGRLGASGGSARRR